MTDEIKIVLLQDDPRECTWWSREGLASAQRSAETLFMHYGGEIEKVDTPEGLLLCLDNRTRVYVVLMHWDYEDDDIMRICSTREKAEAHIADMVAKDPEGERYCSWRVQEWTVDAP